MLADKFLAELFPDKDERNRVIDAISSAIFSRLIADPRRLIADPRRLIADPRETWRETWHDRPGYTAIVFYGEGNNGKSTLGSLLQEIFRQNVEYYYDSDYMSHTKIDTKRNIKVFIYDAYKLDKWMNDAIIINFPTVFTRDNKRVIDINNKELQAGIYQILHRYYHTKCKL